MPRTGAIWGISAYRWKGRVLRITNSRVQPHRLRQRRHAIWKPLKIEVIEIQLHDAPDELRQWTLNLLEAHYCCTQFFHVRFQMVTLSHLVDLNL